MRNTRYKMPRIVELDLIREINDGKRRSTDCITDPQFLLNFYLFAHPVRKLTGKEIAAWVDYLAVHHSPKCSISIAARFLAYRLCEPDGDLFKRGYGSFTVDAILQAHKRYGMKKAEIEAALDE